MKKKIKSLFMDVDGTLTDGKIYMGNDGELFKAFNIKDGCGIKNILIPQGIEPIIITGRCSDILINRCKEIGIYKIYQGKEDKLLILKDILSDLNLDFSECAYIGDDINDLDCMNEISIKGGIVGAPNDAANEVMQVAKYLCERKGGEGAVREFIEWLVDQNKNRI